MITNIIKNKYSVSFTYSASNRTIRYEVPCGYFNEYYEWEITSGKLFDSEEISTFINTYALQNWDHQLLLDYLKDTNVI